MSQEIDGLRAKLAERFPRLRQPRLVGNWRPMDEDAMALVVLEEMRLIDWHVEINDSLRPNKYWRVEYGKSLRPDCWVEALGVGDTLTEAILTGVVAALDKEKAQA